MAGSAVAVFLSAIALLCLCLCRLLPDPAADPVVRAHRRAGRHHAAPSSQHVHHGPYVAEVETQLLRLHATGGHEGIPDIETFRDKLDRLPDWTRFDAELGPLDLYFGPDGRLYVRERLVYLFLILDRSPRDGGVSLAELEAWLRRQAAARLEAVTRREMAKHDRDGDGVVALDEYIEHGRPGGWLHKFASADGNGDGSLNAVEFNDFLHPEDSSEEKAQRWLLKDKLRQAEMGHDGDGRLSLEEFVDQSHVFHHSSIAVAEKKFRELDADMDNYLTVEEARPIIKSLVTGEFSHATSQAKLLMKADSDNDGKLSLEEMLNDCVSFYDTVYMDNHYSNNEVDNDFPDEL
ncbi:hypothetical protein BS78_03G294100 [Paspalum vaginatum]|nr:hypothetical protein BS78_03G294100 [Paspalum vaginatum]